MAQKEGERLRRKMEQNSPSLPNGVRERRGWGMSQKLNNKKQMLSTSITTIARTLRKEQTSEEKKLWKHLRNRQLDGLKFLRQHPVIYDEGENRRSFYVVDFYCAEYKLVVELDGSIHDRQIEEDAERQKKLRELGCGVLRIRNDELKNIHETLDKIRKVIGLTPRPPLFSPKGSKRGGEASS
jgi:very-short-patch-repair endonuclease